MTDAAPSADPEAEVVAERRGALGLLTLNRPKALNALTHGMVRALAAALDRFEAEEGVRTVAIRGAGGRAFCAGGDIRSLREAILSGRGAEAEAFWREEYALNARMKRYPKPLVALVDGICMGGGVGVSMHGSHVALAERARVAMPECGIGFAPDVGATFLLPRLKAPFGVHMALTGAILSRADALAAGLGTHAVDEARFAAVLDALAAGVAPDAVLAREAATPEPSALAAALVPLTEAYAAPSVEAILAALHAAPGETAREAAAAIRAKCPTSLKVALAQVRAGSALSFEEALRLELRVVVRVSARGDFAEGIRAVIVDKDGAARWSPARLEEVDEAAVAAIMAPLPDDLALPPLAAP